MFDELTRSVARCGIRYVHHGVLYSPVTISRKLWVSVTLFFINSLMLRIVVSSLYSVTIFLETDMGQTDSVDN
jgi:hypothetical protein